MVSVIIPIIRNDPHIKNCVESITKSTYKDIEIIIIDEGLERSRQRNIGVERSRGDYILILDSDMTINPYLLDECVNLPYDGLYVPEIIIGAGFWIKVRNFERSFYNATRVDAIRFFRRKYWIPFDENLTGAEDWDWDRKFKGTKGITISPLYHNEGRFNLRRYIKKKSYYSKWLGIYSRRYPNCPELNPFYRYCWVFVEKGKWRKILRAPVYFIAVIILKLFIGIAYLCVKKY